MANLVRGPVLIVELERDDLYCAVPADRLHANGCLILFVTGSTAESMVTAKGVFVYAGTATSENSVMRKAHAWESIVVSMGPVMKQVSANVIPGLKALIVK